MNHATPDQSDSATDAESLRRRLALISRVFDTADGLRVLQFIQSAAGRDTPAFVPGSDGKFDPLIAAFRDGRRSLALDLERWLLQSRDPGRAEPVAKGKGHGERRKRSGA